MEDYYEELPALIDSSFTSSNWSENCSASNNNSNQKIRKPSKKSKKWTSIGSDVNKEISDKRKSRERNTLRGKQSTRRKTRKRNNVLKASDILLLNSDEENTFDCDIIKENRESLVHKRCTKEFIIISDDDADQLQLNKKSLSSEMENETNSEKKMALEGFDPDLTFSDSDSDIYSVNHNAIKASALQVAKAAMETAAKIESEKQEPCERPLNFKEKPSINIVHPSLCTYIDDDMICIEDPVDSPPSPLPCNVRLSQKQMVKMSKKTEKLLKRAQRLGQCMDFDLEHSFNKSSIDEDLFIMDDNEANPVTTVTVKHGITYSKFQLKKNENLSLIYERLAELHGVRFDCIVLSLGDHVLSPNQTPGDLQITVADIIDCGIIRKSKSLATKTKEESSVNDPNTLTLKFQCSQFRGSVVLSINKFEKMKAIMQTYAEQKGLPLSSFRFMFDGEKLDPSATPDLLDFEGGECIDVYTA